MGSAGRTSGRNSSATVAAAMGKNAGGGCERQLNGLEQRSSPTVSALLAWVGWIVATVVQFVCALLISQYEVSHSDIRSYSQPSPPPPPPVSNLSNVSF